VNKDKSKGWAQEKPTSNSVGKGEGATQNIDPPINTIASNDESAMNFPGSQNKKNVEKDAYDLKRCCESIAYR
jgi:hypothetical protein